MPWIERVQVDEGFLDGLDLELVAGLNVVIGARGTGKTSLLELIRFALRAPAFTEQAARASEAQVQSVLGRGRVKLTVRLEDGTAIPISRAVGGGEVSKVRATVLAQNEIEAVGASAVGRLHLLDRFWDTTEVTRALVRLRSQLEANAVQVRSAAEELVRLRLQTEDTSALEAELAGLEASQHELLERTTATEEQRTRLNDLQALLRQGTLREQLVAQAQGQTEEVTRSLDALSAIVDFPTWPEDAGPDPTMDARAIYASAVQMFLAVAADLDRARNLLATAAAAESSRQAVVEDEARELRRALGALDAEASAFATRISEVNERLGTRRAIASLLAERTQQLRELLEARDALFAALDGLRDSRFAAREEVARTLNGALGPLIRVDLVRSGATQDYEDAIVEGLRGSGLHKTIAPVLTAALSPLELARAAESGDAGFVATVTGLPVQRVESALVQLVAAIPRIISCDIDDRMDLYLLDGTAYKPSTSLSIGQRCTTVLPILLQSTGDILVIDQPEDHLDNAFVTSTLVQTLKARRDGEQVILASHNANIPVLGEADRVVHLASDGSRGYVETVGSLMEAPVVQAITDVMEGGEEAFLARAAFYGSASGNN